MELGQAPCDPAGEKAVKGIKKKVFCSDTLNCCFYVSFKHSCHYYVFNVFNDICFNCILIIKKKESGHL